MENNSKTFICADCGREISEDESVVISYKGEEITLCKECEEKYAVCSLCGAYEKTDNMTDVSGEALCEYCYENETFDCSDCGRVELRTNMIRTYSGRSICENCYEDNYFTCDSCGEIYHYDDYAEDGYCCCCRDASSEWIGDYHNTRKIDLKFYGDNKENTVPYLGIELEVDSNERTDNDDVAKGIHQVMNQFVNFEYDGSLNHGFENITMPATFEYHNKIRTDYERMFKTIINGGLRSHDTHTCGLHVHFNRNFFEDNEDLYITRLLYIVEKFWNNLSKFSRRNINELERWARKYNEKPAEIVKKSKEKYNDIGRYHAINLTNSNTIEFRLFKGTLNINTFLATIELCNRLVTLVRNVDNSTKLSKMTWEQILDTDTLKAYWETVKNRAV